MKHLDKRLQRIEGNGSDLSLFDMLTESGEPATRDTIKADNQKYIQVPTPFGMGLKKVPEDHPHGRTKQQHLEIGNDITFEVS